MSAMDPSLSTVTVTSAVASIAFSAETLSRYSYVLSSSTSSGTSKVGVGPSAPLTRRSVFDVFPRAVQT